MEWINNEFDPIIHGAHSSKLLVPIVQLSSEISQHLLEKQHHFLSHIRGSLKMSPNGFDPEIFLLAPQ